MCVCVCRPVTLHHVNTGAAVESQQALDGLLGLLWETGAALASAVIFHFPRARSLLSLEQGLLVGHFLWLRRVTGGNVVRLTAQACRHVVQLDVIFSVCV